MIVSPEQQRILLDLADLDVELKRLAHRAATLPEIARLDELKLKHQQLGKQVQDVQAARAAAQADADEASAEAARLSARISHEEARLNAGEGLTSKDLVSLQAEVEVLKTMLDGAEERQLDVLGRLEDLDAQLSELGAAAADVGSEGKSTLVSRNQALADIEAERVDVTRSRGESAEKLEEKVRSAYEESRSSGGVGAAARSGATCPGCGQEFSGAEVRRLESAPVEELLSCEDCGCLIVRV